MRFRYLMLIAMALPIAMSNAEEPKSTQQAHKRTVGVLLFPGFEILDAAGPMEVWGNLKEQVELVTVAAEKKPTASYQGPRLLPDYDFSDCPKLDILLIPGGFGVKQVLENNAIIDWVKRRSQEAELTLSVCNGASILAKTGLLDGKPATTNKAYWAKATKPGPKVNWVHKARWVDAGTIVTSSGVSAGMDMSLAVVERLYGTKLAEKTAQTMEYEWHRDSTWDPFAER